MPDRVYDAQGNEVAAPGVDASKLVQGGGQIAMVGPDGWRGTIPAENLQKALNAGFRPEAAAQHHERVLEQQYGDSPVTAGAEGLARGATFGLSDTVLNAYGQGTAERKARNPIAAGVGEVGGAVAGLGLTGVAGAAGAAGEAAFGGTGLLARAGAAAVRGGIEGGAMGLGQGISDVALSKDPMSAEAIAGSLGHHVLLGGVVGGAGGAGLSLGASGLGAALGAAGKAVTKAATKMHAELAEDVGFASDVDPALRQQFASMSAPEIQAAHKAETATLEAVRAEEGTGIAKDLGDFYRANRNDLYQLRNQLPDKDLTRKAIRAVKNVEGVLEDPRGLAANPVDALKPVRVLDNSLDTLSKYLPDAALTPMREQLQTLENRIVSASGKITSPTLDAMNERLAALTGAAPKTPMLDAMAKTAGAAVGGAIGHAIPLPGMAYAGAWLGTQFADAIKPVMKKVLGAFSEHAGAIEDGASNLFSKLSPPPAALNALKDLATAAGVTGESDYEKATKAIAQAAASPEQTQAGLQQSLAGLHATAPQLAEQVSQQLMLRVNFLASKIQPQISMGLAGKLLPPSDSEQATFARYVAAASDPLRLLKELRAGMLMPETVETHDALYPAMKAKIEAAITTHLADPTVASKVPYSMRLQLGMLLGPGVDPTLDPSFVALMQSSYQQQPDVKPPSGGSATNPNDPATAAQRLTMR